MTSGEAYPLSRAHRSSSRLTDMTTLVSQSSTQLYHSRELAERHTAVTQNQKVVCLDIRESRQAWPM